MERVSGVLVLGVLAISLLLEGAVLYFVDDRSVRLYVGLGLLFPIAWMFARTNVAQVISELPGTLRPRRYLKMRAQVKLLLAEIRRLNWMAVDGERGFRDRKEAAAEMDAIEGRMRDLVTEIRREAGRASDEVEPVVVPDETPVRDE